MGGNWRGIESRIARVPGLGHALKAMYERSFVRGSPESGNWYRGIFSSFKEAQASAPATRPLGYDNEVAAALYQERTRRVFPSDYPVMYWLGRLFEGGCTSVFDLGGHIGIAYYAYQRYLDYPPALRWCVHDVPAVNAAGMARAEKHDPQRRLAFAPDPSAADGFDVILASGSLQYLDYTLADLVGRLARPPRWLLLNLVPIHMSASFFTLQNMGAAYCPYRVTAEREFVDSLKAHGYALQDRWENPDRRCEIALQPRYSLDRYFGYCFDRG